MFSKKKKRNKKSNIWKLTDDIIKINDIVKNQSPEFSSRFNLTNKYTCLRDLVDTNIYIKEEDLEKFKSMKIIYDNESDLINIDILKQYKLKYDVYSLVANKAVPAAVNIKFVWYCNIMDVNVYIETVYILDQKTNLFKDLLNFQGLKDKHNLR